MALLSLDPENAAASLAARVKAIANNEAYIRQVVQRYDGLKKFQAELEKLGIAKQVAAIVSGK